MTAGVAVVGLAVGVEVVGMVAAAVSDEPALAGAMEMSVLSRPAPSMPSSSLPPPSRPQGLPRLVRLAGLRRLMLLTVARRGIAAGRTQSAA